MRWQGAASRFLWGSYSIVIVTLAVWSVADAWLHYSPAGFALELFTDVAVVSGLFLYLSGVRVRVWLFPAMLSLLCQVYLLAQDPFPDLETAVVFIAVVSPAFIASALVARRAHPADRATA